MKGYWVTNRPISQKEMQVLVILARSAGCHCGNNHLRPILEPRYAAVLNGKAMFYVTVPHPDQGFKIMDITYEEAIEYFKDKIKERQV